MYEYGKWCILSAFADTFQYLKTTSPWWGQFRFTYAHLVEELEVKIWSNIQRFLGFSSWKENSNVPWCTMITFSESRGLFKLPWRSIASRLDGRASTLCAFTYPTFPVSPVCSPVLCVNSSAWEAVLAFGHQMPSWHYFWSLSPQGSLE